MTCMRSIWIFFTYVVRFGPMPVRAEYMHDQGAENHLGACTVAGRIKRHGGGVEHAHRGSRSIGRVIVMCVSLAWPFLFCRGRVFGGLSRGYQWRLSIALVLVSIVLVSQPNRVPADKSTQRFVTYIPTFPIGLDRDRVSPQPSRPFHRILGWPYG